MTRPTELDRDRIDPSLAPVFGMLVRLLGTACLAAAVAILVQGGLWAVLACTDVRSAGLESVVAPETATGDRVVAGSVGAGEPAGAVARATDPTADLVLSTAASASTVVGAIGLVMLPAVLLVSFLFAALRAPRSAAPCLGGLVWSLVALATAVPWSGAWPELAWGGLLRGYGSLVAASAAGPTVGSILVHAVMPLAASMLLVLISWRAGNALHGDLLAAEAILDDAETGREAAGAAARGVTGPSTRGARGLDAMERAVRVAVVRDEAVEGSPLRRVA